MRLGVIADIHGNLPALEAVLADLATQRVDHVVDLTMTGSPVRPRATGWAFRIPTPSTRSMRPAARASRICRSA